ncbi:MAG: acetolactate synthase small subunit [Thermoprotei archaeon]
MSETEYVALKILAVDEPGVLFKVVNHFRRLNINVEGVTLTRQPGAVGISSIIVVFKAHSRESAMVKRMLTKSVGVLDVRVVSLSDAITRELVLVRIKAPQQPALKRLVEDYGARVISVEGEYVVLELTGEAGTINSFINSLSDFGLVSVSRTGLAILPVEEAKKFAENIL